MRSVFISLAIMLAGHAVVPPCAECCRVECTIHFSRMLPKSGCVLVRYTYRPHHLGGLCEQRRRRQRHLAVTTSSIWISVSVLITWAQCVVFLCRAYLMRFGGFDMCTFAHKLPCLHRHAARKVNRVVGVASRGRIRNYVQHMNT